MKLFGPSVDLAELQPYVDAGLVSIRKHPTESLFIYNYTPKCQYTQAWDDVTMQCRGLIVDEYGMIIARPFVKFHNLGDPRVMVPNEPFEVFEKVDGSLGILYWTTVFPFHETPAIASRGSFESDQAKFATAWLWKNVDITQLDPEVTYLFEIVYPENRIVVNYGDRAELVLLAGIHTSTGEEMPYSYLDTISQLTDLSLARCLGVSSDPENLPPIPDNEEGYVLRFENGLRVKAKGSNYLKLHRLITGVNARTIWECLRDGADLSKVYEHVPDEFHVWVQDTESKLWADYGRILKEAAYQYGAILSQFPDGVTRAQLALMFQAYEHSAILWNMLDGKSYDQYIWNQIKPAASKSFRKESEEEA